MGGFSSGDLRAIRADPLQHGEAQSSCEEANLQGARYIDSIGAQDRSRVIVEGFREQMSEPVSGEHLQGVCVIFPIYEAERERIQLHFIPYSLLVFASCLVFQLAFFLQFDDQVVSGQYSAFAQNAIMGVLFVGMLVRRGSSKGQSMIIAVAKCLGTLAPTIQHGLLQGFNIYVLLMGAFCFVWDVLYIVLLHRQIKNEKLERSYLIEFPNFEHNGYGHMSFFRSTIGSASEKRLKCGKKCSLAKEAAMFPSRPSTSSRPKLTKNPKRLLDLAHLLFASLWFGGFAIMLALSIMIANGQVDEVFGAAALGLMKNIVTFCIPALMITGIVYGLFTKWGFIEHGWIIAKWVLSIAVVASTAIVPMKPLCLAGVVAGMVVLFTLSIFKPHKNAQRRRTQGVHTA